MSDAEHKLRHALADALRSNEPGPKPSFSSLWAAAHQRGEGRPKLSGGWAEALTSGVAVASVAAMGILIAASMRERGAAQPLDTALYSQLIAQAEWTSPTDALLDARARFPLAGLPELPAVSTNPSLELPL
jgi:hypothetical protein